MNINLIADARVQLQATDQDTVMFDDITSESDIDIAHFTLATMSNALSESHDSPASSNGGSARVQKQAHTADFIWVTSQCWNND